jgi:hypothetical protein
VLVDNNEVGDFVCSASLCKLLNDIVSSVYPVGVREDKPKLLGELEELRRRVARRREENLGVVDAGARILVVDMVRRIWKRREGISAYEQKRATRWIESVGLLKKTRQCARVSLSLDVDRVLHAPTDTRNPSSLYKYS